ncbi:hypothetical protein CASFOL_009179 [Castilleja foliolosa]|uniref:Uncharacterized protein n=1 Tax=Castilleja foliolosa TaxID=1961234 RepID=A0ABD3DY78_9LAMI
MASLLHRTIRTSARRFSLNRLSTTANTLNLHTPSTPSDPPPPPPPLTPNPRTRTPLEKQFESWLETLKPSFTESDVNDALRAQSDPELAIDIFRWTAHECHYKHTHSTYLTMIEIAISGKRYRVGETLIEEVIVGAWPASLPPLQEIRVLRIGEQF